MSIRRCTRGTSANGTTKDKGRSSGQRTQCLAQLAAACEYAEAHRQESWANRGGSTLGEIRRDMARLDVIREQIR
jgi:hypothetical protein